jgi:NAD(P)-dependent dehydrogenase (short-subunit alcohol dehydrogenase family)
MALSFTAVAKDGLFACPENQPTQRQQVLVTGAAGNIGSYFAEHSHRRYQLRLMVRGDEDKAELEKLKGFGELVTGDLDDLPRMKELCQGVQTVLHLAAAASPNSTWEQLLPANIVGAYNMMVAAKHAGCERLIYASSIHAVSGYPPDVQVKTSDPVNPGDLYGVSKCFGEALGRYMATQEGLSVIALRIGAFQPLSTAKDPEGGVEMMDMFVSRRDLNDLIQRCIDAPDRLRFAILHGVSNNRFKRLDISDARELVGYNPQDDSTQLNPVLEPVGLDEKVRSASQRDPAQKSGIREDV